MKLHEIKKGSEIYVAKLVNGANMRNIDNTIYRLKFKRITTKETKTYLAEWCVNFNKTNKIDCVNPTSFGRTGDKLVFAENDNDEMFVAIVCSNDMSFYVNLGE